MQPCRDSRKVRAITTFISHTPHYDTWIILITFSHTDSAIHKCSMPIGSTRQCPPQSMLFNIRFVHHIKPYAVTEFIPTAYIRIMTGTHGIDISLFHQENILKHTFVRHDTGCARIMFMAVYAPKTNRIAIYQQLPVLYFNRAETYRLLYLFYHFPARILQCKIQPI